VQSLLHDEAANRTIALFEVKPELLVDELIHELILGLHPIGCPGTNPEIPG